ncbi:MAG: inositol monophosphatase family protein [Planctomycetota bacterium]
MSEAASHDASHDSSEHAAGRDAIGDAAASRLEVARAAAAEVAELALRFYQSPELEVLRKDDGSEVTPVDREGETLIRRRIAAAFPEDAILGEEHGEQDGRSGWRWVLDPIDGTRSFAAGMPSFCTLIGIEHDGQPVAGFTQWPALGETLEAIRGRGARWRTRSGAIRPARVSAATQVSQATIQLGAPSSFAGAGQRAAHPRFAAAVRRIRGWDDGFAFALVATGRVDGAVQCGLSRWDLSAFAPILAEAGATLAAWDGGDPLAPPGCVLAGSPDLVHGLAARTGDQHRLQAAD